MNTTLSLASHAGSNINKKATQKKRTKRAKRACYHCKKAKTSCSNERPCSRCVRLGLSDTCIDTPRSDINEEEKKLWEQTLAYLTKKSPSGDKEEENMRQMIVQYARRASGENIPGGNFAIPQSKSITPTVPPSFMTELDKFNSNSVDPQMEYLAQQNEFLAQQVQELLQQLERKKENARSFYNFSILSTYGDVAFSRWSYPGYSLLDYNRGFLELSRRNPLELQTNKFNVRQLHHEKHVFSCSAALYLLSEGLVEYIEMNQEWWTPAGTIPVKTFVNVNLDDNQQTGEVILFSKRSNVPFPQETLFKPLDIGLSKKAKSRSLPLEHQFAVQNYLPYLLDACNKDEDRPYKIPRQEEMQKSENSLEIHQTSLPNNQLSMSYPQTIEKHQEIAADQQHNSSYSQSPPGLSPSPTQFALSPTGLIQIQTTQNEQESVELEEESLSFLESLADPDFTEFPEFTDMVQSIDSGLTEETIESLLTSESPAAWDPPLSLNSSHQ